MFPSRAGFKRFGPSVFYALVAALASGTSSPPLLAQDITPEQENRESPVPPIGPSKSYFEHIEGMQQWQKDYDETWHKNMGPAYEAEAEISAGQSPTKTAGTSVSGDWVEGRGRKPWLTLGTLGLGMLLLVYIFFFVKAVKGPDRGLGRLWRKLEPLPVLRLSLFLSPCVVGALLILAAAVAMRGPDTNHVQSPQRQSTNISKLEGTLADQADRPLRATITFGPLDNKSVSDGISDDGAFSLHNIPAGPTKVTVAPAKDAKVGIPSHYADPSVSGRRIEVQAGKQDLRLPKPFEKLGLDTKVLQEHFVVSSTYAHKEAFYSVGFICLAKKNFNKGALEEIFEGLEIQFRSGESIVKRYSLKPNLSDDDYAKGLVKDQKIVIYFLGDEPRRIASEKPTGAVVVRVKNED